VKAGLLVLKSQKSSASEQLTDNHLELFCYYK